MFAASTYEEIECVERQVENKEIVVFLFVKPTTAEAVEIIKEFEYIHYNSEKYCSIYAIGYSDDFDKLKNFDYKKVDATFHHAWCFSMKAFTEFKKKLEDRINWEYSGEIEVLILQNNPNGRSPLDFSNYVAIDVNRGLREGYIDSFQRFMESLIRSSKHNVTANDAIRNAAKRRISIKSIISVAIDDCKKVPTPCKVILKDYLFYRCANRIIE